MFTGLVEKKAAIQKISESFLQIERPAGFDDIHNGSSISVSGICLSVTQLTENSITFDIHPETWSRTTLPFKKAGDMMNVERPLTMGARLDGHIVQGHVEATAVVEEKNPGQLVLEVPSAMMSSIKEKGSVAIDGVSLTVASKEENRVTIALIPTTERETTLGKVHKGDRVNIETDFLLKR